MSGALDARWLALPLSARGLVNELAKIVDDDGGLEIATLERTDVRAIGNEVARLLCAFRSEYPRVRRDVAVLVHRGFLVFEDSRLRLVDFELEHAVPALDEAPSLSQGGSAKRMRLLRERRKAAAANASPSHVTVGDVTRDARSDGSDASLPLSFNKPKLILGREERHRDAASDVTSSPRVLSRDTPFNERARAIAEKVGVRNPEVVWLGFVAHFAGKKLDREWEDLWQKWGARQVTWDKAKPDVAKQDVDLDAPWMRAAIGGSS